MNSICLISTIPFYCVLLIFLTTFCYLSTIAQPSNAIVDTGNNGIEFLKHHDSLLNMNFSYPSNWTLTKNAEKEITLSPSGKKVGISIKLEPSPGQSLENLALWKFDDLKKQKITNIRNSFVDLKGARAYEFEYKYDDGYTLNEIIAKIGTYSYTIVYEGKNDSYNKNLPIYQKIRDSLNFTSANLPQKDINFLIAKKSDIKLLDSPVDIAVNPSVNKIYVASPDSNVVSVIDEKTDKIIKRIDIANGYPNAIDIDSQSNRVYIVNSNSNSISVLNSITDEFEIHKIPVGEYPIDIAIDEMQPLVFVSNKKDNTISVIDGIFNTNIKNITVGESPAGLSVNPITHTLYVANSKSNNISVIDYSVQPGGIDEPSLITIDGNEEIRLTGIQPSKVVADINSNKVYVTNYLSNTISVINGSTRQETGTIFNYSLLSGPFGISYNPSNNKIYVANSGADTLSVINGSDDTIIDTVDTGDVPNDITVNRFDNLVYVANQFSRTISIIDSKTDKNLLATSFNVKPVNSGTIRCNGRELPLNAHIRIPPDSNCEAESNSGFSFESWKENLPANSSKVLTKSPLSNSLWEYIVARFTKLNDNSTLRLDNTGNFEANFMANPEPIRQEYLFGIYTLAATIFTGWLIPNLTRWLNSRKQNKISLNEYNKMLESIRNSNSKNLEDLQDTINKQYAIGKINQSHFDLLNKSMERRRIKIVESDAQNFRNQSSSAVSSKSDDLEDKKT